MEYIVVELNYNDENIKFNPNYFCEVKFQINFFSYKIWPLN
jgi:hypothetical protein